MKDWTVFLGPPPSSRQRGKRADSDMQGCNLTCLARGLFPTSRNALTKEKQGGFDSQKTGLKVRT